jgi:hypothetical protein
LLASADSGCISRAPFEGGPRAQRVAALQVQRAQVVERDRGGIELRHALEDRDRRRVEALLGQLERVLGTRCARRARVERPREGDGTGQALAREVAMWGMSSSIRAATMGSR